MIDVYYERYFIHGIPRSQIVIDTSKISNELLSNHMYICQWCHGVTIVIVDIANAYDHDMFSYTRLKICPWCDTSLYKYKIEVEHLHKTDIYTDLFETIQEDFEQIVFSNEHIDYYTPLTLKVDNTVWYEDFDWLHDKQDITLDNAIKYHDKGNLWEKNVKHLWIGD